MSDAYGKGIVRAQVKNTNLRAYATSGDITSAESIQTCLAVSFFGQNYADAVDNLNDPKVSVTSTVFADVDTRSRQHRRITIRDVAAFYGQRPCHDLRVWYLSPYKFVTEWEIVMLRYPQCLRDRDSDMYHAALTEEGVALLTRCKNRQPRLEPGVHYQVKDAPSIDWIAYPEGVVTDRFRHTWIIRKRKRPVAPMFIGSPVPMKRNDSADRSVVADYGIFPSVNFAAAGCRGSV